MYEQSEFTYGGYLVAAGRAGTFKDIHRALDSQRPPSRGRRTWGPYMLNTQSEE